MLETAERGVERIQRHLHGIEWESMRKHFQMDRGIFVPGETNETNLALLLSFLQGLNYPAGPENKIGIVVVNHFVDLPNVEVIGFQTPQRLFQHLHRYLFVAAMSADLRHQDSFVAAAAERLAKPFFTLPVVILHALSKKLIPASSDC